MRPGHSKVDAPGALEPTLWKCLLSDLKGGEGSFPIPTPAPHSQLNKRETHLKGKNTNIKHDCVQAGEEGQTA